MPDPGRTPERVRGPWQDARRRLLRNPLFLVSAALIALLLLVALWPGLFTSTDPLRCDLSKSQLGPAAGHPFGFDAQGCDIYARTVRGARASVAVGVLATTGTALTGTVLGGIAGFCGGWWDAVLSRVTDLFFGIPLLLGALVFLTLVPPASIWVVVAYMTVFGWPQLARVARSAVLAARHQDYVTAARALGAGRTRLIVRHVLPNALAPVIVVTTMTLGGYVSLEATLSYLGVGLRPPAVSWGIDISAAAASFRDAPHELLFPAGALSLTVLAFVLLGDAVREALDPGRD